nr:MAG TPA: hypothetical protein [Caudoviricetes sp.]
MYSFLPYLSSVREYYRKKNLTFSLKRYFWGLFRISRSKTF